MIGLTVKGLVVEIERISTTFCVYITTNGFTYDEADFIHIIGVKDPRSFFYNRECPKLLTRFALGPEWRRCGLHRYRCDNVVAIVYRGIVTMFEINDDRLLQYDPASGLIYDIKGSFFELLTDQNDYDVIRKLYKEAGL